MKTHGRYAVVAKPNHASDKLTIPESYDDLEMAHMRAKTLAKETGMFHIVVDTEVHDFKDFEKKLLSIRSEIDKIKKGFANNCKIPVIIAQQKHSGNTMIDVKEDFYRGESKEEGSV
jgi:hypothetical protein